MDKIKMINMLSAVVAVVLIYASVSFADTITGLSVDANGKVGIGTSTPQSLLNLEFNAGDWNAMKASGILLTNTNTTYPSSARIFTGWYFLNFINFDINNTTIMTLYANGDGYLDGALIQTSDISLKENIIGVDSSLEKIVMLRGVTYNWTDKERKGDRRQMGLIAQEVEQQFPEAVFTDRNGKKGIAYSSLFAPVIEAMKELKTENETLKSELEDLKKKVAALQKR